MEKRKILLLLGIETQPSSQYPITILTELSSPLKGTKAE
jgi:hypothetical protein